MPDGPNLVYLMGTGRSGSTILQVLLSSAEGVSGGGELTRIIGDAFIEGRRCSCGRAAPSCPHWSAVRDALDWSDAVLGSYQHRLDRLDGHVAVPQHLIGGFSQEVLEEYRKINLELLKAIRAVTGAHTVVDGSKYAARALALSTVLRPKVLCLTREPAGLLEAWAGRPDPVEQPPKSRREVLAYYAWVMASVRAASTRIEDVLFVRFEDLMHQPAGTLRRIGDWAGLDLEPVIARVEADDAFDVGHLVRGNRLRRRGTVHFHPPPEPAPMRGKSAVAAAIMGVYKGVLRVR